MKLRTGFVSNSSSSSFCIIGTYKLCHKAAEAVKITDDDMGYGEGEKGGLEFHGSNLEDACYGLNATIALQTRTIPQAKQYFIDIMKKKGINLEMKDIELHFGESSNE